MHVTDKSSSNHFERILHKGVLKVFLCELKKIPVFENKVPLFTSSETAFAYTLVLPWTFQLLARLHTHTHTHTHSITQQRRLTAPPTASRLVTGPLRRVMSLNPASALSLLITSSGPAAPPRPPPSATTTALPPTPPCHPQGGDKLLAVIIPSVNPA